VEERPFSDISYTKFLAEEKLMGSRCKHCDVLYLPPRPICIRCHHDDMQWEEMKGRGKLAAFTCIGVGPAFMTAEGFSRHNPYCSGVIALDEGVRVDARIEGVDTINPASINIGMPLTVKFLHRKQGDLTKTYLAFAPIQLPT
jgi:uncharacterized OB-fold protein